MSDPAPVLGRAERQVLTDEVERIFVAANGDRPARRAVLVAEGWWHPNVKSGAVHDHFPALAYPSYHRECSPVYRMQSPATREEFDDLDFGDE